MHYVLSLPRKRFSLPFHLCNLSVVLSFSPAYINPVTLAPKHFVILHLVVSRIHAEFGRKISGNTSVEVKKQAYKDGSFYCRLLYLAPLIEDFFFIIITY